MKELILKYQQEIEKYENQSVFTENQLFDRDSKIDIYKSIISDLESLQSKGKTKGEVKTDMRYHAVQFAGFILKHAETFTTKEGMFTWKRPNGEEQSSSELYSDWIEEYGEQPLLSEIVERTQQQQKEAWKRRDNRGNYLDNLRPMDI